MRVALLDLGTNTFNMLIADIDANKNYRKIYASKVPVKLGEGGINENRITEAAFERGLLAIHNQIIRLKSFACEQALAFGTSALRSATNGQEFVDKVAELYDLNIKIISGDHEAQMIYQGVKLSLDLGDEKSLIMDIGGGSNEFIIANQHEIFWKKSYPLGVSRLLQWLKPSDPISANEIQQLKDHLNEQMQDLYEACSEHGVKTLIGSSGSFDSLSEMISIHYHNEELDEDRKYFDFKLDDFHRIKETILQSSKEKRMEMRGLHRIRVDMIVMAVVMIDLVIDKCHIENMRQSAYSLKEGILFDVLEGNL